MFSFFKSNNPVVVVAYWLFLIGFRVCFFVGGIHANVNFTYNEPLSHFLFTWLKSLPVNFEILLLVLGAVVNFIQALLINGTVNNNKMTTRKHYTAGLLFIISASFFKETLLFTPASLALLFMIMATSSVFKLSKKEKAYGEVFDVGFLSAIAICCYFPCMVLIPFAYIGLGTVRAFSYREWSAVLLGFLTPFFVTFTCYVFLDTTPGNFLPTGFLKNFHPTQPEWITIAGFFAFAFINFVMLQGVLYSSAIQVRKFVTLLIFMFVLLVLALPLQQQFSYSYAVLFCLPVSILSSQVLVQIRNSFFTEVIHLILILLVLVFQYLPLLNLI